MVRPSGETTKMAVALTDVDGADLERAGTTRDVVRHERADRCCDERGCADGELRNGCVCGRAIRRVRAERDRRGCRRWSDRGDATRSCAMRLRHARWRARRAAARRWRPRAAMRCAAPRAAQAMVISAAGSSSVRAGTMRTLTSTPELVTRWKYAAMGSAMTSSMVAETRQRSKSSRRPANGEGERILCAARAAGRRLMNGSRCSPSRRSVTRNWARRGSNAVSMPTAFMKREAARKGAVVRSMMGMAMPATATTVRSVISRPASKSA